jgi:hypothetical protein
MNCDVKPPFLRNRGLLQSRTPKIATQFFKFYSHRWEDRVRLEMNIGFEKKGGLEVSGNVLRAFFWGGS